MDLANNRKKLEVGQVYPFKIKNLVSLEGIQQYILEYEGFKFMVDALLYTKYNFEIGQIISCKIDKINCAGKMFIEPEHPYFKAGNHYIFKIRGNQIVKNFLGEEIHGIEVIDDNENLHWIPNNKISNEFAGKEVKLKIRKIRKGMVQFYPHKLFQSTVKLTIGEKYMFHVLREEKHNQKNYLIVQDEFQKMHAIDLKLYHKFDLAKKSTINARVIKFNSENRFMLEPDHPEYKIGKTYAFKYQIIEEGEQDFLIEVQDCFQHKIELNISKNSFSDLIKDGFIYLIISDIKKSIPLFDIS